MSLAQKKVLFGFAVLSLVFGLTTCSPEADSTVPTNAIQIINIPAKIYRTNKDNVSAYGSFFKVYVQLSANMTTNVAKGEGGLSEAVSGEEPDIAEYDAASDTYTVTIHLKKPNGVDNYEDTNWKFMVVVISPATVNDIFDIDARAGYAGPTTSPTVVFNWNLNPPKTLSKMAMSIEDYEQLYRGDPLHPEYEYGLIKLDTKIGGLKKNPDDYFKTENGHDLEWSDFIDDTK